MKTPILKRTLTIIRPKVSEEGEEHINPPETILKRSFSESANNSTSTFMP